MIYITGDTHGSTDMQRFRDLIKHNPKLSYKDYIIIAGDFGCVWDEKTLKQDIKPFNNLPCKILFVDGNHENFDLLKKFPISNWKGGKVQKISNNIMHLMRGQVFNIDNKKIFTFGGAESIDKMYRTEYVSWWKEETPNKTEYEEAIANLKKVNNNVDYIITHSIDEKSLKQSQFKVFDCHTTNYKLNYFENNINYKHWYFGHYHYDLQINDKKTCLYKNILELNHNLEKEINK